MMAEASGILHQIVLMKPTDFSPLEGLILGQGRFGNTYRGNRNERHNVLKRLRRDENMNEEITMKNVKSTLPSPASWSDFVTRIDGIVVSDNYCYLVYDYYPYGSIKTLMQKVTVSLLMRLKLMRDAARGLAWIHQELKMPHNDIRPENILVDCNFVGKVTNVGVYHLDAALKKPGHAAEPSTYQSAAYKAPEISFSRGQHTEKTDVYSYGKSNYEVCPEVFRYATDSVDMVDGHVGSDSGQTVEDFITQVTAACIAVDPIDRPTFQGILSEFKKEIYLKKVDRFIDEEKQKLKCSISAINSESVEEDKTSSDNSESNSQPQASNHITVSDDKFKGCIIIHISAQNIDGRTDKNALNQSNLRENRTLTKQLAKKFKCNIVAWKPSKGRLYLRYREENWADKLKEYVDKGHFSDYLTQHTECDSNVVFKASISQDEWDSLFDNKRKGPTSNSHVTLPSDDLSQDGPEAPLSVEAADNAGAAQPSESRQKEPSSPPVSNPTPEPENVFDKIYKIIMDEKSSYYILYRAQQLIEDRIISDIGHCPIIHACVARNRMDLIKVVYWSGYWSEAMDTRLPSDCWPILREYVGKTPLEIARLKSQNIEDDVLKVTEWNNEKNPLRTAIRKGANSIVSRIIDADVSPGIVNKVFNDGLTPLHWACIMNKMDIWNTLITHGANPKGEMDSGENLLHFACAIGRPEIVEFLIKDAKMKSTDRGPNGRSPVDYTAETGDIDLFNKLVKLKTRIEYSALILACMKGQSAFLKGMFNKCRLDMSYKDRYGRTPLHHAAENGHALTMMLLVEKGARMEYIDKNGRNSVHYLADKGHGDAIRALHGFIKRIHLNARDRYIGSDNCFLVKGSEQGRAAYHYVEVQRKYIKTFLERTRGGNLEISRFGEIVQSGFGTEASTEDMRRIEKKYDDRVNSNSNIPDMTPLHLAIMKEQWDAASALVVLGADVNIPDKSGCSPLHLAAMKGHTPTMESLIEAGAKVSQMDNDGLQPHQIAVENKNLAAVRILQGVLGRDAVRNDLMKKVEALKRLIEASNTPLGQLNGLLYSALLEVDASTQSIIRNLGAGPQTETT